MKLATQTPLPLTDALAVAYGMAQRPDLDSSQRLAPDEWLTAASAALVRRDRTGLETLLRIELAPAVAKATALLGATVATAVWWPDEFSREWVTELVVRLDGTCHALLHATKVVRLAEQWEALVDPERGFPTLPGPKAGIRLLEKAAIYLHTDQQQDDARIAVSRDLGDALSRLASPAEALVIAMDAGTLDELITSPLQQQLYGAYGASGAALAYELALLGEGPLVDPSEPLAVPE